MKKRYTDEQIIKAIKEHEAGAKDTNRTPTNLGQLFGLYPEHHL